MTNDRPVALVTGATSGIGRATAMALERAGYDVIGVGRRSGDGRNWSIDLARPAAADELMKRVVRERGRLDVLVNNAGAMLVDDVADARVEDWRLMTEVNVTATAELTRAAIPLLKASCEGSRGHADVVFIGSLAAVVPSPGRAFYAGTKAAVEAFADVLRIELANTDVRVCVVAPGLTDTGLRGANRPEALERMADAAGNLAGVVPLPPERVAESVVWCVDQPGDTSIARLVVMPTRQGR